MKLPKGAWVVVADGHKHLIFENAGTPVAPALQVRAVERQETGPEDRPTDRPGRFNIPGGGAAREAVQESDRNRIGKLRFSGELAATLDRAAREGEMPAMVLVADARTLGALRPALGAAADRVLAEIEGDFAHRTTSEIEDLIQRS